MQTIMSLTEARDQALIERVRNGDEEAVTAIFNRYSDLIYNIALQVVGTPTSSGPEVSRLKMVGTLEGTLSTYQQ